VTAGGAASSRPASPPTPAPSAAGSAGHSAGSAGPSAAQAIQAEIIRNRLESIAEEMGIVLRRVSRSPIVSETRHYSAALLDGSARLVAQVPGNLGHLAPIARSAAAALDKFAFDLQDDDVLIVNDPYAGGSSLGQLTLVTVTMSGDDLVLFPACRLQLTDIGGSQPGGLYPAAKELFQEGDIIPPVRLATAGRIEKDVLSRLLKNNRTPGRYRADIDAMIAANRVARRRIRDLLAEFGLDEVRAAIDRALAYTERLFRSEVARWPDGEWHGESSCRDAKGGSATVHAAVRVVGDAIEVDFAGSSRQLASFVNSPLANTETFTLIGILGFVPAAIPFNEGLLASLRVLAPEGSVVNPTFPAPTAAAGYHVGREIAQAVAAALAQALPERACLPVTGLPLIVLNEQPGMGDRYISQLTMAIGGCGGAHGRDGWGWPAPQSGIDVSSPEVLELQYGLRVVERTLLPDSAGAGRWRGGPGSRVVVSIAREGLVASALVGGAGPAAGLRGGGEGSPDAIVLRAGQPAELAVDPLAYREPLAAGDRVAVTKGGGPGWGSPVDRPAEAVREDVLDGYVTIAGARDGYGVVLEADTFELDAAGTRIARAALARVRPAAAEDAP
jgi:N-methylhydantoinase B